MTRGPSMADVAALAGVSAQTVSRVANGLTNVDPSTKDRVVAAMNEIGYRPNSAARALKTGRFKSIGVIMFTLSTFGNMRTLDAIATAAAQAGYSITLIPIALPTQVELLGAFSRLGEHAVDGVIVIVESHILDRSDVSLPTGLPVVIVDSDAGDKYSVVDTDQAAGARDATRHLLELGHRTVWHVSGPEGSFSASRRKDSWEATLLAAGAEVPQVLIGDWTANSGYLHGLELAKRDDVTAVFAANDQMALGAMRAFHESGRTVPDDISVVGFDDMAEAAFFWPPLTTVHQDFGTAGSLAVSLVIDQIEGRAVAGGVHPVPTSLIVRGSTASRAHAAPPKESRP
jgi:DNA-binding LacI/PurR family transcriptional regulator